MVHRGKVRDTYRVYRWRSHDDRHRPHIGMFDVIMDDPVPQKGVLAGADVGILVP